MLPAEYAALGKLPAEWKPTDVIAEASLIGGIFGKGGGAEVRSALTLEAFEKQFGAAPGAHGVEELPRAQRPRSARHREARRSRTRRARRSRRPASRCPNPAASAT